MTCRKPPCFFREKKEARATLRTIEEAAKDITGDKIRIGILDKETIEKLKRKVEKQEDLCIDWFNNENQSIVTYWGEKESLENFAGERDGEKWADLEDFIIFNKTFMVQYIFERQILIITWDKDRINFAGNNFKPEEIKKLRDVKKAIFSDLKDLIEHTE